MTRGQSSRTPLLPGDGPLAKIKPPVAFVGVLAIFVTGVLAGGGIGALLLGLLAAGVVVLLATTWPLLSTHERLLRVAALAALIAVGASLLW